MASTNQSPQFQKAQGMYLRAKSNDEKLHWLEEMIRECPKHKSAEKMMANLKTRYIKLKEKIESQKKTAKGGRRAGIKKEDLQAVIVGFTNSGKSSLISLLTNTKPEISPFNFTTKHPVIGMLSYLGVSIQIIEVPAFNSEFYDSGLVNGADVVLMLVNHLEDIPKIAQKIERAQGIKLVVFNLRKGMDSRKIESSLKSKKANFVIVNTEGGEGLEELKERLFQSFGKIRVYTKEPGKQKSDRPIVLDQGATIKDVAEKIFHGFSKQIKESFVTGPSSKFPNQKVGLSHQMKDMDIVEFRTR